jgi:hypothetical protein
MPSAANVGAIGTASLSTSSALALGTAAAGTAVTVARDDHVHPTDGVVLNALVNAKGDVVTATADDTPAVLTVGSDGQMLMADSAATAGLRYVDPPANRNLLINGAMQVAQRSTSVSGITSDTYITADRWRLGISGLGTWTQSVESDAPTGSGLNKSLKMLCTTADAAPSAADVLDVGQRLEGQDLQRLKKGTASAEQLTVSFWVKANVTGTYILHVRDDDNARHISATYSVAVADTWERKTVTLPADTTGTLSNDNGTSLAVLFALAAGSNFTSGTLQTTWASSTGANANRYVGQTNLASATDNYWQITGVQLETGPVATPFEFEPFEATLRKCQRYYQVFGGATANAFSYASSAMGALSTTVGFVYLQHHVPTRSSAGVAVVSANMAISDTGTRYKSGTWTLESGNTTSSVLRYTHGSAVLTQFRPYMLQQDDDTTARVVLSMEL